MPESHGHDHHHHGDHDHGHHDHGDHDHGHHHGPGGHVHAPATFGKAFAIGITLNIVFVALEAIYGVLGNSMALLADAGHNLSDVLGLVVAWVAVLLGNRPPSGRFTYGLRSSSILAALFNAIILLVAVGGIATEAIRRLIEPGPVAGVTVMVVAGIGIVINAVTAWLFASGSKGDLNIRGAYLHMLADTGVSIGVVVAGLLIMWTGLAWIDPVVSLVIAAVILWSTWGLLTESASMSLNAAPSEIDTHEVRAALAECKGVTEVHDLHVWAMSTSETALTCHLVMPEGYPGTHFLQETASMLDERFGIGHPTLQIETDAEARCRLAPAEVV
ncbi:cation diffusion facilitator family transporter [Pararhizobium mangrovi]|uniref:Cation transporter n=1 Tax=Pararhizobium mangrovi TaxID=2590452 RepID=A0A506U7W2_9HYPH|nr:cation diffusion facilitator family transporter [Pararhizobium mangrovi]TPW30433.1 cation transporter [Pararhizobium mangrovi]